MGCVFCRGCGAKLDLSVMSREKVMEVHQAWYTPFLRYWPHVSGVLGALVVLVIALALWPSTKPLAPAGEEKDGKDLALNIRRLEKVPKGKTTEVVFTESQINAFFLHEKKNINAKSVSVAIGDGFFKVRIVRPFLYVGFIKWDSSVDLMCVPYSSQIGVRKVTYGHLNLSGPAKKSVVRKIIGLFRNQLEWNSFKNVSEYKAEAGKILVRASN